MKTCGDKTGYVRHVNHKYRADLLSNLRDALEVDNSCISGRTGNNHLRLDGFCLLKKLVIIKETVFVNAVGFEIVKNSACVHGGAVGEMSAFGKRHSENGVTGLKERRINGKICLRAGMRLNVGILCAEKLLGSFDCDVFHNINIFTAAVISLSGIAFGVFVGQHTAHGRHHGRGNNVFRSDEFKLVALTVKLKLHSVGNLFVCPGD